MFRSILTAVVWIIGLAAFLALVVIIRGSLLYLAQNAEAEQASRDLTTSIREHARTHNTASK